MTDGADGHNDDRLLFANRSTPGSPSTQSKVKGFSIIRTDGWGCCVCDRRPRRGQNMFIPNLRTLDNIDQQKLPWAPKTMKNHGFGHLRTRLFTMKTSKKYRFWGAHGKLLFGMFGRELSSGAGGSEFVSARGFGQLTNHGWLKPDVKNWINYRTRSG